MGEIPADILAARAAGRIPKGIANSYLAESRDREAYIAIALVGALTLLVLSLRTYSRVFIVRAFGLDDALAILTVFPYIALIVLDVILIKLGSGRHIEYIQYVLTRATVKETEVLDFYAHIIYTTTLLICRLSGLAFFNRLARYHMRIRRLIKGSAVLFVCAYLPQLFLLIFHCIPVTGLWPYAWQEEINDFKCLQWGIVYSVNGGVSLLCDAFMFTIPALLIYLLQTDRKRKFMLSLVLFPGVLVLVISSIRMWLVVAGQWAADGSWYYNPMLIIELSEIAGTLIALSLPALKPLIIQSYAAVRQKWPHDDEAAASAKTKSPLVGGALTSTNLGMKLRGDNFGGYHMASSEASGEPRSHPGEPRPPKGELLEAALLADKLDKEPQAPVYVIRGVQTVHRPRKEKPK